MLTSLITFFSRFLGPGAEAKARINELAHVAIAYEITGLQIAKAEEKLRRTKENKISRFEALKKRKTEKTTDAVARLLTEIEEEEEDIEIAYVSAKEKNSERKATVQRLNTKVCDLNCGSF